MEQSVQTSLPLDFQIVIPKAKKKRQTRMKSSTLSMHISSIQEIELINFEAPQKKKRGWRYHGRIVYDRFKPFACTLAATLVLTWMFYLFMPPIIFAGACVLLFFLISFDAMRGKNVDKYIKAWFDKTLNT